ncbi:MAG: hypothetical protein AAFO69_12450 [Bacteroidota bacterium]
MRPISFLFLLLVATVLAGCFRPPEFPDEPEINFKSIVFVTDEDGGTGSFGDSLILSIDFQDGDGNLGLRGSENGFPYHAFDIIKDANGDTVKLSGTDYELPYFRHSPNGERFFLTDDPGTLSADYNCQEFEVITNNEGIPVDTMRIVKNPNNLNIFVEFYRKNENGEFRFFDWTSVASSNRCGEDFNGRFPIFDERNLADGNPLAGTIDYSMVSVGFKLAMGVNNTFRIDVRILDRDLNVSNTVSSQEFTLNEITAN